MRTRQLTLELKRHGGVRRGAGRKRAEGSRDPKHVVRARVRNTDGVHVVLRTNVSVPRLRCPVGLGAIRHAIEACGEQDGFRIVEFSIQHNHLHFICEADSAAALSKGMQAFAQSAARAINRAFGRRGEVFAYRFHSTVFRTPTHARRALEYVLGNWRHHHEDQRSTASRTARVDPYSSGPRFAGWSASPSVDYATVITAPAKTWLLRVGWRDRGGGALDYFAIPGPL